MIYDNITECIGNTPVVDFKSNLVPYGKKLYLKLDYFNPNFSVKDRTALGLVKAAIKNGKIQKGDILIESTSGNLGKSLAMLGAVYGFQVIIVVDPKISSNLLKWYNAYGARVEMVKNPDENGGFQKARIQRVKELISQYPNAYWTNQYDNPDNPNFHAETTGKEIVDLPIDSVVGAVSTGGHLCGIGKFIKKFNPEIDVIACDVKGSAVFQNQFNPYLINGVGLSWRGQNTNLEVIDQVCIASDQEAISTCRILAKEYGIMMGGSGGLSVISALAWLQNSNAKAVVAIIPDTGVNYLDQIYDDIWLEQRGIILLDKEQLQQRINAKQFMTSDNLENKTLV